MKVGYDVKRLVFQNRPPTIAELEKDIDYNAMEVLPPLPEVAPITNKLAYKGYMRLKYAWSERRSNERSQVPVVKDALDVRKKRKENFNVFFLIVAYKNEAENLVEDIFDNSGTVEFKDAEDDDLMVSKFSEEFNVEE